MGNSPSQKPFEDDSSKPGVEAAGASLSERVVLAVRSITETVRNKCSVFANLDFAGAFRVDEDDVTRGDDTGGSTTPESDPTDSESPFPDRERPFTQPVREREDPNPPDLRSEEKDDSEELAIYYPDCPDATITSDTWERVER